MVRDLGIDHRGYGKFLTKGKMSWKQRDKKVGQQQNQGQEASSEVGMCALEFTACINLAKITTVKKYITQLHSTIARLTDHRPSFFLESLFTAAMPQNMV